MPYFVHLSGAGRHSCRRMEAGRAANGGQDPARADAENADASRKTNPLGWVQLCSSLKQQTEEAVLPMLYEI
ncbi:hypothetical protein [Gemmiger sp.]